MQNSPECAANQEIMPVLPGNLLLDRLCEHAHTIPDRVLYTFLHEESGEETLTFAQLQERVVALSKALCRQARPQERALLLYPSGLDFIIAFLACLRAGIVAVPSARPRKNRPLDRTKRIIEDCQPTLILTTGDRIQAVEKSLAASNLAIACLATDEIPNDANPEAVLPEITPETIAFLQYTSGSTGDPKGAIITHGNLAANEQTIQEGFAFSSQSVMVSWLPLFHDMGLIGAALAPIYVGFSAVLLSPSAFLQKPICWLQALSKYGGTCAGSPDFGWAHCAERIPEAEKEGLDLSRLVTAFSGAEPVRASTLDRFYKAFAPYGFRQQAYFPCYGMAEGTLFVSGGPIDREPVILHVHSAALEQHRVEEHPETEETRPLVGCGRTWGDTRVVIADPETRQTCASDKIGEVWVSGGSIVAGYWQKPEETEQAFAAYLSDTGEGPFYRTGDLGFLREEELFITGRLKDLIILRGRNLYPQDIERTIEATVDFVEPNTCAAFSLEVEGQEQLHVVLEANRALLRSIQSSETIGVEAAQELVGRVRQAVGLEHEIRLHSLVFVRPGAFPRTTSGKVQRSLCRSRLLAGELDVIYASASAPLTSNLSGQEDKGQTKPPSSLSALQSARHSQGSTDTMTLIREVILASLPEEIRSSRPYIGPETLFSTLGIDSLGFTLLASNLEGKTGIRLQADTIFNCQSVRELAEYLDSMPVRHDTSFLRHEDADALPPTPDQCMAPASARVRANKLTGQSLEPLGRSGLWTRYAAVSQRFQSWEKEGRYFYHRNISEQSGSWVVAEGKRRLMLGSYSYLGLMDHPAIIGAACRTIQHFGTGTHGARLLTGTTTLHTELERNLAYFLEAEDAIVYSSGFMTNVATITALVQEGDCIIGDAWNHASIMDGCKHSGAQMLLFQHNDMGSLEQKLREAGERQKLVVVDAVYSMEGDIAAMPQVVALCRKYGALLMVDEAHSLGVLGRSGRGIQEHFGLGPEDIDIKMGTLSKTIPSAGGYVAGKREIIRYLRHSARGYIFSSAIPAAQVAAANAALRVIRQEPERIAHLWRMRSMYAEGLQAMGFHIFGSTTPIVPIACPSEDVTLQMTDLCWEAGLYVVPIFYPAVPVNAPRLRTCVIASHTEEDIRFALEVLFRAGQHTGMIP